MTKQRILLIITVTGILILISFFCINYFTGGKQSRSLLKKKFASQQKAFGKGQTLAVNKSAELNPKIGHDFYIYFWFKTKTLPKDYKRLFLIKNYALKGAKPGYALAIANFTKSFYPLIYWNNSADQGRWYSFSEVNLRKNQWQGFLLSYTKGRFLGLHQFGIDPEEGLQSINLGAYQLKDLYPDADAGLEIGSLVNQHFKGNFSYFQIYSVKDNDFTIQDFIDVIRTDPDLSKHNIDKLELLFDLNNN